ncbi:MAG: hypothetical protein V4684_04625 [Pseudomonadota bacterium]
MDPDLVVKYVAQIHRRFWRVEHKLSCIRFAELLGFPELTPHDYSRLTSRTTPKVLRELLKSPEVLRKIEQEVNCPGLFACQSGAEIDRLISLSSPADKQDASEPASSDLVLVPSSRDASIPLGWREQRVARQLVRRILLGKGNIVAWSNPPPVGASFLAYMAGGFLLDEGVSSSFLIRPFPSAVPEYLNGGKLVAAPAFDEALAELGQRLGIEGRPSVDDLLSALKSTRSVLFVLQADHIPVSTWGTGSKIQRLLGQARRAPPPQDGHPSPIVLLGRPNKTKRPDSEHTLGNMVDELSFSTGPPERSEIERNKFYEEQWKRYSALRGQAATFQAGSSRLKRARQYYTAEAGSVIWPSMLRVLAFFASNTSTFSYFDPTSGWERLAGMPWDQLPIDIKLHLAEVVEQARSIPEPTKRRPELRAARWCSTAVYWLTEDAAEDLGKSQPRTDLARFRSAVTNLSPLIDVVERVKNQPSVYKMDMALRAVIQQRWALADPLGRAHTHYQIARRLYQSRDDKDLLHAEFPVEPHWGRSRMHFLSETLRHLVRSCEFSTPKQDVPHQDGAAGKFPDPPLPGSRGCDPAQVINFCFSEIFWKELNGNNIRTNAVHNRTLARRHGAYHLTAELLQLLSHDNELGQPHPLLRPEYRHWYLREVGYAQLDLGDLRNAQTNFERMIQWAEEGELKDAVNAVQARLDLTIVLCAMGDLAGARAILSTARTLESAIPVLKRHDSERAHKQRETRLDAREAELLYLDDDLNGALAACERVQKTVGPVVRDVAHIYIATLGALPNDGNGHLKKAMEVCIRNVFENTSPGLHHEALGFRVALAHIFRKQGMAQIAEVTMDLVYKDVLQYGCSERTYIAMLLEAGRIVLALGRPARAYAAYLRPCFDRATSRGYARPAESAARRARECLQMQLGRLEGMTPFTLQALQKELEGQGDYLRPKGSSAIDPKFSYETASIDQWVSRLASKGAIEQELRDFD